MKKKEVQMIGILILVAVIIIAIIFFATRGKKQESNTDGQTTQNTEREEFIQVMEDGTKLNTSSKLNEEKEFKGLKIGNIQLTNKGDKTQLIADVTNPTQNDMQAMLIKIILLDKSGNEIARIGGRISPIKAGQTMQLSTSAMIDYTGAYDFKIIENK